MVRHSVSGAAEASVPQADLAGRGVADELLAEDLEDLPVAEAKEESHAKTLS